MSALLLRSVALLLNESVAQEVTVAGGGEKVSDAWMAGFRHVAGHYRQEVMGEPSTSMVDMIEPPAQQVNSLASKEPKTVRSWLAGAVEGAASAAALWLDQRDEAEVKEGEMTTASALPPEGPARADAVRCRLQAAVCRILSRFLGPREEKIRRAYAPTPPMAEPDMANVSAFLMMDSRAPITQASFEHAISVTLPTLITHSGGATSSMSALLSREAAEAMFVLCEALPTARRMLTQRPECGGSLALTSLVRWIETRGNRGVLGKDVGESLRYCGAACAEVCAALDTQSPATAIAESRLFSLAVDDSHRANGVAARALYDIAHASASAAQ